MSRSTLFQTSSVASGGYMSQADREYPKNKVDHINDPMIRSDHQRALVQAKVDRACADEQGASSKNPAAAFGKGLADADNPERGDRQETEEHVHRNQIQSGASPEK